MQKFNKPKIDWVNTLFLTLTPVAAIAFVALHLKVDGFIWQQWLLALGFYFATGLSITAGYHRLFSHRAYKAHPVIESLFLFFGAASFQNSLLKWGADHRRHHTKCDQDEDPYSIQKGFFYAHMGWICEDDGRDQDAEIQRWGKDLLKNPRVIFQDKHYLAIAIISGIILPTVLGGLLGSYLGGFALATWGRIVFVHHATFFINSLAHTWGKQTYGEDNSAKDSLLLAFLSYGEGHHNYHHHFQTDYRNGVRWFDFDPTKWLINTIHSMGLAHELKSVCEEDIIAARLKMEHKRQLEAQLDPTWVETSQELFDQLKDQLKNLKKLRQDYIREKQNAKREFLIELKQNIQEEKRLLKKALRQWQEHLTQGPALLAA
jgi:stearoyl-CoA desaturase (delta-9 desaturase)